LPQHQHAFQAENINEVDRVARHVLAILSVAEDANPAPCKNSKPVAERFHNKTLNERLFEAAISRDRWAMDKTIDALRREGADDQSIAFDIVPQIARRLGTAWEEDSLSFGAVTIGCARLQTLVLQLGERARAHQIMPGEKTRNCLVVVPENAHHTLGAIVLTKQLRNSRHDVSLNLGATPDSQSKIAQAQDFDAIMISASKHESPESLRALVKSTRTKGAKSKVFIGGSISELNLDLVAVTGTDYVTNDWQGALDLCV
jgi:methylmalonyl-CoA mutase cobalamin-binding subunit